jgi:hypothetical protein
MSETIEKLAAEFERRAREAEAKPAGSFMVSSQGYREQRQVEARVWREAAALVRQTM